MNADNENDTRSEETVQAALEAEQSPEERRKEQYAQLVHLRGELAGLQKHEDTLLHRNVANYTARGMVELDLELSRTRIQMHESREKYATILQAYVEDEQGAR